MATQGRRTDAALDETLWQEPWRFEFFQAVRLMELVAHTEHAQDGRPAPAPVGYDYSPAQELVRFTALMSRSFPASDVVNLSAGSRGDSQVSRMQVSFMGLTGPAGVLPESYLDLIQQRVRDRDFALRDFFDLFNHRTISLFYRAWEKYRLGIGYERARRRSTHDDSFTRLIESLIGKGTGHQAQRLAVADGRLLAYAGHLSHFPRSAVVLETILADHFAIQVGLEQFVGRWLPLEPEECTRMPSAESPEGQFNQLGVDTVIGARVWDVQSTFGIRIGPVSYAIFCSFLPDGGVERSHRLDELIAFSRFYAGLELDFDVRLLLKGDQVPALRLGGDADPGARLGWNTWFGNADCGDRDEAHFRPE